MARKKSGGFFNKALEFIGLVDEEDPQDYEEEYQDDYNAAGDPYGYEAPAKKQAEPRRAAAPARESARQQRASRRDTRAASRQTGYQARSGYESDYSEQPSSRRSGYDGYSERSASRAAARQSYGATTRAQGARYSYENVRRAASAHEAPAPQKREAPRPAAARRPRTVMYSMRGFEDCREVIQHLLSGNTVVLTLEEMDASITQRALDTLSGAVFALSASIRRASDNTYLLAPGSVEVNEVYEEDREY